jgi:hypothetical protein
VGKIQQALVTLGAGVISVEEISKTSHGTTAARTVLALKTARNILGAQQRTPDNILGKLTIRAPDAEMLDVESRPDPNPPLSSRLVSLTPELPRWGRSPICPRAARCAGRRSRPQASALA